MRCIQSSWANKIIWVPPERWARGLKQQHNKYIHKAHQAFHALQVCHGSHAGCRALSLSLQERADRFHIVIKLPNQQNKITNPPQYQEADAVSNLPFRVLRSGIIQAKGRSCQDILQPQKPHTPFNAWGRRYDNTRILSFHKFQDLKAPSNTYLSATSIIHHPAIKERRRFSGLGAINTN